MAAVCLKVHDLDSLRGLITDTVTALLKNSFTFQLQLQVFVDGSLINRNLFFAIHQSQF